MVLTQNRMYPDPFEFSGIRDYQRTDPMKHINWKASASAGRLMVNQHDSTTSAEVTVFLDVEDTTPISELFRREKTSAGSGRTCVVISKNRTPSLEAELETAVREGIGVLWVCPVRPGEKAEQPDTARGLNVFFWEAGKYSTAARC